LFGEDVVRVVETSKRFTRLQIMKQRIKPEYASTWFARHSTDSTTTPSSLSGGPVTKKQVGLSSTGDSNQINWKALS